MKWTRRRTSQRFSKDGTVFRMRKGGQATIKRVGKTSVDCQVKQPGDAARSANAADLLRPRT
jgi:hypothetical protein